MEKEDLRIELKAFAKNLIDGYVNDTTVLELLGTSDVIDDYIDNQLKERWIKKTTIIIKLSGCEHEDGYGYCENNSHCIDKCHIEGTNNYSCMRAL